MVQSIGLNYIKHAYNLYDPVHAPDLEKMGKGVTLTEEEALKLKELLQVRYGRIENAR